MGHQIPEFAQNFLRMMFGANSGSQRSRFAPVLRAGGYKPIESQITNACRRLISLDATDGSLSCCGGARGGVRRCLLRGHDSLVQVFGVLWVAVLLDQDKWFRKSGSGFTSKISGSAWLSQSWLFIFIIFTPNVNEFIQKKKSTFCLLE